MSGQVTASRKGFSTNCAGKTFDCRLGLWPWTALFHVSWAVSTDRTDVALHHLWLLAMVHVGIVHSGRVSEMVLLCMMAHGAIVIHAELRVHCQG